MLQPPQTVLTQVPEALPPPGRRRAGTLCKELLRVQGFVSPPLNLPKTQQISLSAPGIMAQHPHSCTLIPSSPSPRPHIPIPTVQWAASRSCNHQGHIPTHRNCRSKPSPAHFHPNTTPCHSSEFCGDSASSCPEPQMFCRQRHFLSL